jgi:cobalt/nickel transport system permease protein
MSLFSRFSSSFNFDLWLLSAYLLLVTAISYWQDVYWLAAGVSLLLLFAWYQGQVGQLLRRSLYVILWFNLVVSIGYIALMVYQDKAAWLPLMRLNLRVFLLTLLSFSVMAHINLFKALRFSEPLTYTLVLTQSQISTFRRASEDFQLALASRSLNPPTLRDRYRSAAATVAWLFEKSFFASKEIALALKSRGFFHD